MGMRQQIPQSWDRYEVIRFLEEKLKEEFHAWKVRITSIEETNDFGKHSIYVRYEIRRTTSRHQIPKPDSYHIFDFDMVDNYMKTYIRDEKINQLLDGEI